MRRAPLLVALAACSSSKSEPPPPPAPEAQRPDRVIRDSFPIHDPENPLAGLGLLDGSRQLVLATVKGWDDVTAELKRYERGPQGWKQVGDAWEGAIGANGSAWGRGVHGDGAPAGQDGPIKKEGDGKSPAGAFRLGAAYGYADAAPAGARVAYQKVSKDWLCIDDRASQHYNKVLDTRSLDRDWKSYEDMRRKDDLYRWVLFVEHNPKAEPGAGSCIFLHLWSGPGGGTAGCTSMAPAPMEMLLAWLDPAAHPAFVLLPRDRVEPLRADWGLP